MKSQKQLFSLAAAIGGRYIRRDTLRYIFPPPCRRMRRRYILSCIFRGRRTKNPDRQQPHGGNKKCTYWGKFRWLKKPRREDLRLNLMTSQRRALASERVCRCNGLCLGRQEVYFGVLLLFVVDASKLFLLCEPDQKEGGKQRRGEPSAEQQMSWQGYDVECSFPAPGSRVLIVNLRVMVSSWGAAVGWETACAFGAIGSLGMGLSRVSSDREEIVRG